VLGADMMADWVEFTPPGLVALYSVGAVLESIGLNLTVWSYHPSDELRRAGVPGAFARGPRPGGGLGDALGELLKAANHERHG
jgi:hypothetical protein